MTTVNNVLSIARGYIGVSEASGGHRAIVDSYNAHTPLPQGYRVSYDDEWCDVFVSVVALKAGAYHLIGKECGVERHKDIFKQKGIWKGISYPQAGDIVVFKWNGDRTGFADHIGFVESVQDGRITTIEGNTLERVGKNNFLWNDWRIQGYARPNYSSAGLPNSSKSIDELAREVIAGLHGNGEQRKVSLGNSYNAVQKRVDEILKGVVNDVESIDATGINWNKDLMYNGTTLPAKRVRQIVALAKRYNIKPSFLIVMLHFEGIWGNSNVGRVDNNWGGMTYNGSTQRPSGIQVTRGLARPVEEGGHYMHYQTVEDFLIDWSYMLRPTGSYKVSGKTTFNEFIKGLFKVGGATYDYAGSGYAHYLQGMQARKHAIEQAIGAGTFVKINQLTQSSESKATTPNSSFSKFVEGDLNITGNYLKDGKALLNDQLLAFAGVKEAGYRWGSSYDMNQMAKSGFYLVGYGKNCPTGLGFMLVGCFTNIEVGQVIIGLLDNKIYRRRRDHMGVWSAWVS